MQALTVGELIAQLSIEPPESNVIFGRGDLTLYRVKDRTGVTQIEFNEPYTVTPP